MQPTTGHKSTADL